MGFFKGHKGRRSYDLLSNYNYFMPSYVNLLWVVLLMAVGVFIGTLILAPFMKLGYQHEVETYGMLIAYPLMFIPAMIYASAVSRHNDGFITVMQSTATASEAERASPWHSQHLSWRLQRHT